MFDVKTAGPIFWDILHRYSYVANTEKEKREFIGFLTFVKDNFPCEICRSHIKEYTRDHPITNEIFHTSRGLFRYIWEFHNAVNLRLKKQTIAYEDALAKYAEVGVCLNCGKDPYEEYSKSKLIYH